MSDGKLYRISKPILCEVGTSSKQGKFSLQLAISEQLVKFSYNIGQLGAEPSSLLFGMDECFHFGYSSDCNLPIDNIVSYVNQISQKDSDIIISGCQSEI